jgi:hypothetical protein
MAYMENVAPKRPAVEDERPSAAAAPDKRSNQEKTQSQSAKFSTPSLTPHAGVKTSNQLKTTASTKGTGVAGRPSTFGAGAKDFTKPAVENPDGKRNRT